MTINERRMSPALSIYLAKIVIGRSILKTKCKATIAAELIEKAVDLMSDDERQRCLDAYEKQIQIQK